MHSLWLSDFLLKLLLLCLPVAGFQSRRWSEGLLRPKSHGRHTYCSQGNIIEQDPLNGFKFHFRDARYSELGQVADVVMSSFYVNSTNPWKQLFRLAELNRIQQAFPRTDGIEHRNIVAVTLLDGKEEVIGFCSLDNRTPNRNTGYRYNPRPYVSDLCISPHWRRRGVAKAIIRESERHCKQAFLKDEIFIRVESENIGALNLYESLGYEQIYNPDSPKKKILLLRKELSVRVGDTEKIERR